MATQMLYGKVHKGKVIRGPKPKWEPLKVDTLTGMGQYAKSALGGKRRER